MKEKELKKIKRNRLIAAIVFSIIFIISIVLMILGFKTSKIALVVIGLMLTFLGIYMLPLMWFNFASWCLYHKIYKMIKYDNIDSTFKLAEALNKKDKDITKAIKIMISYDLFSDYSFKDEKKIIRIEKK